MRRGNRRDPGMPLFRCTPQTQQRVERTGVDPAMHQAAHPCAAPARRQTKSTVIIDATLMVSERNAGQAFADGDAKRQSHDESEWVSRRMDVERADLLLQLQQVRAGLREHPLSD
jgi:hypothetical protein